MNTKRLLCLVLPFFALTQSAISQGSLTPPGAPAPIMKTLQQIEPRIEINATNTPGDADSLFRIAQPGSYYVTGNVTGVSAKSGIEIAASHVTVDLNGFLLAGVSGSLDGITISGTQTNTTIRNGTISGFGGDGIDFFVSASSGALLEDLHCSNNGTDGITTGIGNIVRNCTADNNGANGINPLGASLVINCSARGNTTDGIGTGTPGAAIIGCVARSNGGSGFSAGLGSLIADCISVQNAANGIQVFGDCTVRGNTCTGNGSGAGDGAGILVSGNDNRIEGNTCTDADRGIDVDANGNIIVRNTCSGNTTNWDVSVGNVILVVAATTSPAFTGNAGGTAPGSTDPNANFTY